jgi:hypothetical protein
MTQPIYKPNHLLDIEQMRVNNAPFFEELVSYVYSPRRLEMIATMLGIDIIELLESYLN